MAERLFLRFIHWLGDDLRITPNQITVGRVFFFVPGWLIWLFRHDIETLTGIGWRLSGSFAFVLVTLVIVFDVVDGALARATGQVSQRGKALDPAVDKIITYSTFALFWNTVNHAAFFALLSLDVVSTLLRGASVHGANEFGKKKALSQNLAKIFFGIAVLAELPKLNVIGNLLLWFATLLATISVSIRLLPEPDRRHRLFTLLPQMLTLGNLLCGVGAIRSAADGQVRFGVLLLFIAMSCDMADGAVARRLGVTTRFGKTFDSIADLVSFGFAPGVLAAGAGGWTAAAIGAGVLYILATAYRLYDYGRSKDRTPAGFFRGLPSPAAAWLVAAAILSLPATLLPALLPVAAILMISFRYHWQHFSAILPTLRILEIAASFLIGLLPALLVHPASFIAGPIVLYCFSPLWRKPAVT
ncbi:MAG: CDP-alcohol phosphatidyltransferase family protein [Thermodesulfobacteriota bacterium]